MVAVKYHNFTITIRLCSLIVVVTKYVKSTMFTDLKCGTCSQSSRLQERQGQTALWSSSLSADVCEDKTLS